MGTGCPPPVYVRVRRYGWRRREHAWTGGRVHRGPGAIATMMHAAGRFKAASRSPRRTAVGDPVRTAGCSLSVYDPCHLSGRIVIESMSLFGTFRTWRDVRLESVMRTKADIGA